MAGVPQGQDQDDQESEEAMLAAALAISMQEDQPPNISRGDEAAAPGSLALGDASSAMVSGGSSSGDDEENEEELMQKALALSMTLSEESTLIAPPAASAASLSDTDFVAALLGSTGADQNDPLILAALEQIRQAEEDAKEKEVKKSKK